MEWKGATGRVRGGALLNKDAQSCVSPPNDTQEKGIRLEREP